MDTVKRTLSRSTFLPEEKKPAIDYDIIINKNLLLQVDAVLIAWICIGWTTVRDARLQLEMQWIMWRTQADIYLKRKSLVYLIGRCELYSKLLINSTLSESTCSPATRAKIVELLFCCVQLLTGL